MEQKICGALNPMCDRAIKHARAYYESIRNRDYPIDILYIAKNTNFTIEQVSLIRDYIFTGYHLLSTGFSRFEPCYEMAESWRRLSSKDGKYYEHDALMLFHELYEIALVHNGTSQAKAHELASQQYDYQTASDTFYSQLKLTNK